MSSSFLVSASTPTGNNRRIELAGMDLWLTARIDNVFIYPSEIKLDQLKEALSQTLSIWPIVTGRILCENNENYFIEMCDNSIPIIFVANDELKECPFDSNVILEFNNQLFLTFVDQVRVNKLINDTSNEPLVRLKLTHIIESNEWILGISWYHPLGDGGACLNFSNTLSTFYQQMEPTKPLPIFERRLWREDEADESVLPIPKRFLDSQPIEDKKNIYSDRQLNYDPINLYFSGEQLQTLRTLAGGDSVTIQDALTAYIILTLNKYCYYDNDERRILHTTIIVNYRGIDDSIAPKDQVANCLLMALSDNFDDPYSLSNIAKAIRQSIIRLRDPKIIGSEIAKIDQLMRRNIKNNKSLSTKLIPNEFHINSNYRFDWADQVHFGYKDKTRFYTSGIGPLCLRVFRLNPKKDENKRDQHGAQASFRLEKHLKEIFVNASNKDIQENFENINK